MKITQQTEGQITIKNSGGVLYLAGLIFIAVGAYIFYTKTGPNWFGIVFMVAGLLPILGAQNTIINLEKGEGKLRILRKRLVGKKEETFGFGDVSAITLRQERHTASKGGTTYNYPLAFNFKNRLPLDFVFNLNRSSGAIASGQERKHRMIGQTVAQFLGVPFQEQAMPTITDAVQAIKETISEQMDKK